MITTQEIEFYLKSKAISGKLRNDLEALARLQKRGIRISEAPGSTISLARNRIHVSSIDVESEALEEALEQ